jgi:2-polyprenyl-3-methyl-5-hydroxy-6-metoxy-1,4-benzoquinol methylase
MGRYICNMNGDQEQAFSEKTIQEVKNYWDTRPCNVFHSPKKIGTREYFDEVEARKYFVEPHIPVFAEFKRWKGKKVLEIGCGIGTDTINFARAGAFVTAVDLSEHSIDIAKKRAEVFNLDKAIRFYCGNAEHLMEFLPHETYDLIYSFGVIHHTIHPDNVIAQTRNYLKPGGEFKVMVYHRYSWKVLWIILNYGKGSFWKSDRLIARYSEAQTGCPVTYTYSRREFKKILESHGFTVKYLHIDHIFPYRIPDYIQYNYVREWYFRWIPSWFFRWMERRYGWHLCASAVVPSMEEKQKEQDS